MNKQQAKEKLAELEQKAAELRAIIDKPTVKPMFPRSWKEGAISYVSGTGEVKYVESSYPKRFMRALADQGRTFYTCEAAEAFAKRERARAYCLERINEVNEGDNGFKAGTSNYYVSFNHHPTELFLRDTCTLQSLDPNEYIRTKEAARQLINDPEFFENWKCWKGVG